MALQATLYNFDVELAHHDRAVYESLALRVACHPSESAQHLIAPVLAYLLEFRRGIAFWRVWNTSGRSGSGARYGHLPHDV
jgi:uncharacterized protein YaeQ